MNGKEFLDGEHTVTLTGRQWAKLLTLSCHASGRTSVYTNLQHSLGFSGYIEGSMDEFLYTESIREKLINTNNNILAYHLVETAVIDFFENLPDEQDEKEKQKQEIQGQIEALKKQLAELENN